MKRVIEKFYGWIFEDKDQPDAEPVPYANKVFMFYFTIIVSAVALFLVVQDILKNIEKMNVPPQ